MGVGSQWNTESSGESEIGKLQISVTVDEKVLWLQVSVKDAVAVAVSNTLAQLAHELLNHIWSKAQVGERWSGTLWESLSTSSVADWQRFHILLQVAIKELEDKVKLVTIGVDNVEKAHDVLVVHLL